MYVLVNSSLLIQTVVMKQPLDYFKIFATSQIACSAKCYIPHKNEVGLSVGNQEVGVRCHLFIRLASVKEQKAITQSKRFHKQSNRKPKH